MSLQVDVCCFEEYCHKNFHKTGHRTCFYPNWAMDVGCQHIVIKSKREIIAQRKADCTQGALDHELPKQSQPNKKRGRPSKNESKVLDNR